ncbi:orotate phosphoribosyltransferase [Paenibacillus sp. J2TS4]|uniref:orotate phosphoribosyltransferase n=1 Tax=Paenibacillus sp. J2TS4 TaxID=2807194 RepID=UPI001B1DC189|nr:orotate phosphoribosyltransferase [Paenibacillus sp. J2TS4]GIP36418.1 orotate phosphoribosyltransferase [Paenibacillus sp. J2TS4]
MNLITHNLPQEIAEALLQIGAVALRPHEPFTWTSGIRSPIYCDNRLIMSYPSIRNKVAEGFAAIIRERYPEAEVIAGTATGGIAHAAWVADRLNLPMVYVRGKAKGHGKQNLVEGVLNPGSKVVVIEDLISTGGSSLKAALAVKEAGGDILSVLSIFTYQFDQAKEAFGEQQIVIESLSDYTALLETAVRLGQIEEQDIALLQSWRKNPQSFGNN